MHYVNIKLNVLIREMVKFTANCGLKPWMTA